MQNVAPSPSRRLTHRMAIAAVLLAVLVTSRNFGLGEESVGNDPLNGNNYTDWPGIMDVINDKARVYRQWVNGDERFYFEGDTDALNKALKQFAKTTGKVKEVIIRPGSAKAGTFHDGHVTYDWDLHIMGGIAAGLTRDKVGSLIWPKDPRMTIYIGKNIKLEKLEIPDGLTVVELKTLKERITKALKSENRTARGWGCAELARLDPYDATTMKTVADKLKDDDSWVRLNVVHTLATLGRLAKPHLPALNAMAANENDRMKSAIAKTITAIEQGVDVAKDAAAHQKTVEAISKKFATKK